jgi:hypothetical protein
MLSLPSNSASTEQQQSSGVMGYLTPKRTQALIARESAVAVREAEVARREAELLAGAPGGVIPSPSAILCPACPTQASVETVSGPVQTIIKEVVKEDSLVPPGWIGTRSEELLDRELKIAERERETSKREEAVNRREHDASRRENWIMEQLIALGNDLPQSVEEEYVYEPPKPYRKQPKHFQELPPLVVSETAYETETKIVVQTQFVTVPPPANTRLAPFPTPQVVGGTATSSPPRTTTVEIITEEDDDEEPEPKSVKVARGPRATRRPPTSWFGGW